MRSAEFGLVGAVLLLAAFSLCPGCGGGGGGSPAPNAGLPGERTPPTVNRAPTISVGTGATARAGSAYELMPTAADPDDDALSFSAENLPPWASLDAATGRISGTPAVTDVGQYEDIIITVADASHRVASPAFSIVVVGEGNGVATLTWQAPVSKVDGSALDDLAGYRIRYGRDAEDLNHNVFLADPARTSYEFSTLDAGVWYFAVVAINAYGLEGPSTVPAKKSL